jgi:hypothetical protein
MRMSRFMKKRWLALGGLAGTAVAAWRLRHGQAFRPEYWQALVHVYPVSAPLMFVPFFRH